MVDSAAQRGAEPRAPETAIRRSPEEGNVFQPPETGREALVGSGDGLGHRSRIPVFIVMTSKGLSELL
jgi:hypothetical protein